MAGFSPRRPPVVSTDNLYFPAPTEGWNPDTPASLLPTTQAPVLDNLIPQNGWIRMRGGMNRGIDFTSLLSGGRITPAGFVSQGSNYVISRATPAGSAQILPWDAIRAKVGVGSATIMPGSTAALASAGGIGAPMSLASADIIPGPRWQLFGGTLYGLSYDASTAPTTSQTGGATPYTMKNVNLLTMPSLATPGTLSSVGGTPTFSDAGGGSGFSAWNVPNDAQVEDGINTTAATSTVGTATNALHSGTHGFAIPGGATILGIQIAIKRAASSSTGITDKEVEVIKGGTVQTTQNKAHATNYPTVLAYDTYGGPTDLWGVAWTPADINAVGFGAHFRAQNIQSTAQVSVDIVRITVYYTVGLPASPTAYPTTAPRGAFDIKVYLNRIWLLGGVDVPGAATQFFPARLFYTNPGSNTGATLLGSLAADWKDPIAGTTNIIDLDQNVEDFGIGLAIWNSRMIIFRNSSVWVISGSTSSTFAAKVISSEVGCIDAKSIIETDHGVYFMSLRGLMFTDGVSVKNVSGPVQLAITTAVKQNVNARILGNPAYVTSALTSDGMILVTMSWYTSGVGFLFPTWSALYNPFTGSWVRISSKLFEGDNSAVLFDAANLFPGPIFTSVAPRNYIYAIGNNTTVIIESPANLLNAGDEGTGARLSVYDQDGSTYHAIPATWQTRNFDIIEENTRKRAAMSRFFIDYTWPPNPNNTNGWNVAIYDASIDSFGTALVAPAGSAPITDTSINWSPRPFVQRAYSEFHIEVDDGVLVISWDDVDRTAPTLNAAAYDIFGVGISIIPAMEEPIP